jgi:hypothetical protein
MPTSHRADTRRTADRRAPFAAAAAAGEAAGHAGAAGLYLTDEIFLYRVVRVVAGAAGEMVDLEDCFLLDVVRVPLAAVRARRLRVITAAGRA